MPARNSSQDYRLIYVAPRAGRMRLAALAGWVPGGIGVGLLILAPGLTGGKAAPGSVSGWMLPAGLVALALVWLAVVHHRHSRCVRRVVLGSDGQLRVTTSSLWGENTERLRPEQIKARGFRLDRAGEAPQGFEILGVLGFRPPV